MENLTESSSIQVDAGTLRQHSGFIFSFWKAWASLFTAILLLRIACNVWIYPHLTSPLRRLPTAPHGHWLFGQAIRIWKTPLGAPMRDWFVIRFPFVSSLANKVRVKHVPNDGMIRYLGLFNRERVLICSPQALAEVLVTKSYGFSKPSALRWSIGRIVGVGLLLAEGDAHRAQRRNLLPAFSFRHIKNLYPIFWTKSQEIVSVMVKDFGGEEQVVDISPYASRVTLDIIGLAGMGRSFGAIANPESDLVKTYEEVLEPSLADMIMSVVGRFIPFRIVAALPVRRNRFLKAASQRVRALCRDMIRERKVGTTIGGDKQESTDIISTILRNDDDPTQDRILEDELMTFLAAGHETTASALVWAIYLLCKHPHIQQELRRHVQEIPDMVTNADIDGIPYLEAVCNEVLRVYGPLPLTSRRATANTVIQGQMIPRGTHVVICPWATNFDPSLWGADVDQFKPERWLANASGGAKSNFAMLTFSHGPRGCIGQRFARAEFACLLASWIARFEFALADPALANEDLLHIRRGITVRPNEMRVKVKVLDT